MDLIDINVLNSTVRLAVPVLLACLAGLYSERAGIVDIGLEGKLLASAFAAAAASFAVTALWPMLGIPAPLAASLGLSAWTGLLAGIGAALLFSLVHGLASINFKGNQTISGVALNFLAAGLTTYLGQSWFKRGGQTPNLPAGGRFTPIKLPFAAEVKDVPVIGPIYSGLISGHNLITYFAFIAVPITAWLLFRTRFGLRLRAVGENPEAADTLGVNVYKMRYAGVLISGALTALGGVWLAYDQHQFTDGMSGGRGYIALTAMIFGKWNPLLAVLASLFFGFAEAIQIQLQTIGVKLPVQFIQMIPYVLTIVVLAGSFSKSTAPSADGIPYEKE